MRPRIARLRTGRQTASPGSACGVGPGFRLALAAALVLAAALGRDVPCRAGLLIEAPSLSATPGSSSSFDLLLVNTNPAGGASYNVAADSFELSLSGPVGVTFTGVSINTIVPYIYVMSGTTVPGGGSLSFDTFPNSQFTASDSEFAAPGFRTVGPGDTFGLAHVSFTVSPTAALGDTIAIASGTATSLSDENGNAIPFAISNGLIAVPAPPVPEPCALAQAATAAMIGLGFWWWRRGKGAVA